MIDRLVSGLPSAQRWAGDRQAVPWLILSAVLVTVLTVLEAPLRPGVGEQLLETPRFLLEMILGVLAIICLATMAIRLAVPAADARRPGVLASIVTTLWLASYVIGLYVPTMELGMLGKREHCVWETLLYALPTMATGFWLVSRGYVLNWIAAGFAIGLVSGFIPGHLMQVACMYDARHILQSHIGPALLVGILGALVGLIVQYWPRKTPASQ